MEAAFSSAGRDPGELTFSLMTTCIVGRTAEELRRRARRVMAASGEEGSEGAWLDSLRAERLAAPAG